jgi:transcription elongation factor GreA
MEGEREQEAAGRRQVTVMMTKPFYLTEQGWAQLLAELERLRTVERMRLIEALGEADTGGDWMDSAEHTLVESDLAFVEARIRELEAQLDAAVLIPEDPDPARINVGDTVLLLDEEGEHERYTIVGPAETDPAAGLISNESPLGHELLNHEVGDEVTVHAPAGDLHFKVVAIEPHWQVGEPQH